MPSTIKIKYSDTVGAVPTLAVGEIAINRADKKLYYTDNSNVVQSMSLVSSSGGAGGTFIQTEVDFGTGAHYKEFTITDANMTTIKKPIAQVAWVAPTGKDLDEIEMDDLQIRCQPLNGSFKMYISDAHKSRLHGQFKINITY